MVENVIIINQIHAHFIQRHRNTSWSFEYASKDINLLLDIVIVAFKKLQSFSPRSCRQILIRTQEVSLIGPNVSQRMLD